MNKHLLDLTDHNQNRPSSQEGYLNLENIKIVPSPITPSFHTASTTPDKALSTSPEQRGKPSRLTSGDEV